MNVELNGPAEVQDLFNVRKQAPAVVRSQQWTFVDLLLVTLHQITVIDIDRESGFYDCYFLKFVNFTEF